MKRKHYKWTVVGLNLKTGKTFLHMSNANDKKERKEEFFELYPMGQYGCLEVVQLPGQPERRWPMGWGKRLPPTLCWNCENALGKCSWSKSFEPVPGWTAQETIIEGNRKMIPSYLVISCPEFKDERGETNVWISFYNVLLLYYRGYILRPGVGYIENHVPEQNI